jgi:hypothetical protein
VGFYPLIVVLLFQTALTMLGATKEVVMRKSVGRWYVEYFGADDVLLTEFFHYEEDAKAFNSLVGGYIDYDHYRVIAEIEGVLA